MKENTIKPIETLYNGMRFRSRLEARWAVFFDALGMKYEYEPEGYALQNGSAYLPDFYLPTEGMFAEVKPEREGAIDELKKVEQFVMDTKNVVLILPTIPAHREPDFWWFTAVYWHPVRRTMLERKLMFKKEEESCWTESNYAICDAAERGFWLSNRYGVKPSILRAINDLDMPYRDEYEDGTLVTFRLSDEPYNWTAVSDAMDKARSARFEHGEKPKV